MEILIKNVKIVTMNSNGEIIDDGYVYVKGNIIKAIGTGEYEGEVENPYVISGKNYCVMPGLINCHTHTAMTLLRGYGEGLPLMRWLNEKIWPAESKFMKEHIEYGTKLGILEMIKSGTTTFNDMYFMEQIVEAAAAEVGMRGVFGYPIIGDDWRNQLDEAVEACSSNTIIGDKDAMTRKMLAPHSPYTLSYEALESIAEAAQNHHIDIHTHIAETQDEINIIKRKYNCSPASLMQRSGIFNNKVVAAHCVHMSDEDLKLLNNHGVSVVYNPQSNMKLSSGVARINEMLHLGINVCIGTDGASSNNDLNMFEEIETGAMLQKLWYKDPTCLDARSVLQMATSNAAKAIGFSHIGKLEQNYLADLVIINMDKPNMVPCHDVYSNLVFSANGSEVETVIINGKLILHKGELRTIDEEKIIYESNKLINTFV